MNGLDHGIGHFQPFSLTQQRRLSAYPDIAIAMKISVKYFDNFSHRNPFDFNIL
jgi:hypothetical protein